MRNAIQRGEETIINLDLFGAIVPYEDFWMLVGRLAATHDEVFQALISMLKVRKTGRLVYVLGITYTERAVPHLIPLLKDPDVRWAAMLALLKIGDQAVPHLIPLLKDPDPDVRQSAAWALKAISRKQGIRILLDGSWVWVGMDWS